MVWGVDDEVANLDVEVHLEVELEAELNKGLKNLQGLPWKAVLSSLRPLLPLFVLCACNHLSSRTGILHSCGQSHLMWACTLHFLMSWHPDPGSLQRWMVWGHVVMSTSLSNRSSTFFLNPFPALPRFTSSTIHHSLSTLVLMLFSLMVTGGVNLAFAICHCATIKGTNWAIISFEWTSVLAFSSSTSTLPDDDALLDDCTKRGHLAGKEVFTRSNQFWQLRIRLFSCFNPCHG